MNSSSVSPSRASIASTLTALTLCGSAITASATQYEPLIYAKYMPLPGAVDAVTGTSVSAAGGSGSCGFASGFTSKCKYAYKQRKGRCIVRPFLPLFPRRGGIIGAAPVKFVRQRRGLRRKRRKLAGLSSFHAAHLLCTSSCGNGHSIPRPRRPRSRSLFRLRCAA